LYCNKLQKSRVAVFDIDGVLIDCSERIAKCEEGARGNRKLFGAVF
jgi:FMN phosphatase YigB (HAD superfamily)